MAAGNVVGFAPSQPLGGPALRAQAGRSRLLAAFSEAACARILQDAALMPLRAEDVLLQMGDPLPVAAFPLSGLLGGFYDAPNGRRVLCGALGSEAVLGGISLFNSGYPMSLEQVVLVSGEALVAPKAALAAVVRSDAAVMMRVWQSNAERMESELRAVRCARLHSVGTRCAARILQFDAHRVADAPLRLTHELMARVLGVHRPSASVAMGKLMEEGRIVARGRGLVEIPDRERLAEVACDCYEAPGRR